MSARDLVNAGFVGYTGWGDAEADADFRATGGAGKQGGGGGSSGGSSLPEFKFDQAAEEKKAMESLRPYYEKLLKIYNGDINLAKKRMEEDYARGLRYKQDETQTGLADNAATAAERDRKFKLALGDLDQEMNTRGLTTSGIKTGEIQKATQDENYQKSLLDRQARDLALSEKQYKEGYDSGGNIISNGKADLQRFNEDKGFAPTGVEGFMSDVDKKKFENAQEMATRSRDMAVWEREQKYNDYQTGTKPLVEATPQGWKDLLNSGLKLQGLPAV